jgi:hypothetical protein
MPEPDFEWVKARSECSPATVFQQIKLGVESDVKARNPTLAGENYSFRTSSRGGSITAYIQANGVYWSVTFRQTKDGISVHDENDKVMFDATLALNNDGECRLRLRGTEQEYQFWQLRKMALEHLLFDDPWPEPVAAQVTHPSTPRPGSATT